MIPEPRRGRIGDFLVAAVLVFLAHLSGWVLSRFVLLAGPVFSYDILLALMLCCISRPAGLVLLVVFWGIQILQGLSLTFHFISVSQFLASFRFVREIHVSGLVSTGMLAAACCYALSLFAVLLTSRRRKVQLLPLACVALILLIMDLANGSGFRLGGGATGYVDANLAGSPTYNLVSAIYKERLGRSESLKPLPDVVPGLVEKWASESHGGILMVVVESLGVHKSRELSEWLHRQLVNPNVEARWQVVEQHVNFKGSTTSGELRFLCALGGSYSALNLTVAGRCLPRRLLSMGYSTSGLHGFSGRMFLRNEWWPQVGLSRVYFLEDLPPSIGYCGGAFRGACDGEMLQQALIHLSASNSFVYLLTLNAHLPIGEVPVPPDLRSLCGQIAVDDVVCRLTALHGEFFRELRAQLLELRFNPLVVVVGDHAPPFWRSQDRFQYSDVSVPLVLLRPRTMALEAREF
jgi:hypothetical protein